MEELGFFSGFGGRTQTPMVDDERLIVTFVSTSWGEQGPPRHRLFAFDKKTGELLWVSTPGGQPSDLNTQSTPVIATLGGRRLAVAGNADGWVYAIDARTGEKVWGFQLSKLGINTTVAVGPDGTVFAAHGEENVDSSGDGARRGHRRQWHRLTSLRPTRSGGHRSRTASRRRRSPATRST